jgi:hypothetical protein
MKKRFSTRQSSTPALAIQPMVAAAASLLERRYK